MSALLDQIDQEEAQRAAVMEQLRVAFLQAVTDCQADKYALFAPRVRDWKNGGTRLQTVGDLVLDSLDYSDVGERVMQVLLNAAAGRGTQREAQQLLEEIAAKWADRNAE